ncbi:hypothetical protein ACFQLX_21005 [Streptomyces polyrhachis]|uniref:DNA recombination protein RmuC n=1 Tax=Streptomyces polyrhachis TaxID=1282885 RepID=A0ABW2GIQ8_9ACTN
MDATVTLTGSVLACFGMLGAALVAYFGKRGENVVAGYSSLTERLQTERDRLERQVAELGAQVIELRTQQVEDKSEIARLRHSSDHRGGVS